MKQIPKKKNKPILLVFIIILTTAGLLDIKYKGLFYQLLPQTVQSYLADRF